MPEHLFALFIYLCCICVQTYTFQSYIPSQALHDAKSKFLCTMLKSVIICILLFLPHHFYIIYVYASPLTFSFVFWTLLFDSIISYLIFKFFNSILMSIKNRKTKNRDELEFIHLHEIYIAVMCKALYF